jgi:hypothetical protein
VPLTVTKNRTLAQPALVRDLFKIAANTRDEENRWEMMGLHQLF